MRIRHTSAFQSIASISSSLLSEPATDFRDDEVSEKLFSGSSSFFAVALWLTGTFFVEREVSKSFISKDKTIYIYLLKTYRIRPAGFDYDRMKVRLPSWSLVQRAARQGNRGMGWLDRLGRHREGSVVEESEGEWGCDAAWPILHRLRVNQILQSGGESMRKC